MASTEDELGTVLQKFSEHPIQSELEDFQYTSLRDVHDVILNFQNEQRVEKRMINFNRMKRFLEAISELGTEISRFSNCSPFLEPIWCSIRYLLQVRALYLHCLVLQIENPSGGCFYSPHKLARTSYSDKFYATGFPYVDRCFRRSSRCFPAHWRAHPCVPAISWAFPGEHLDATCSSVKLLQHHRLSSICCAALL